MRALAKGKCLRAWLAKELGRSPGAVKYKAIGERIRFRFIDQPGRRADQARAQEEAGERQENNAAPN